MAKSSCCSGSVCSAKPKLRFQYGKNKRGQWYWHIRTANGEIIVAGEGYKREVAVLRVYNLLADNAAHMPLLPVKSIPTAKK